MKNEVDKIIENKFFLLDNKVYHDCLCYVFQGTQLEHKWKIYWNKIRKESYNMYFHRPTFATSMFERYPSIEEIALLRLLLVEDFKRTLK